MFASNKKVGTMAGLMATFTKKAKEISAYQREEATRQRTIAENATAKAVEAETEAAFAENFVANFEALSVTKTAE
ncbi:hypothetical protein APT65_00113 [Trabzonvirus APT65]|uniref:Uncharacterized protein n=1 Tax=Aeromonas phage APT65 TaxID=2982914 RepID=A0A9E8GAC4_9CAUD|nr:hypothetical protein APT65_00113 [Aeromonas phage APT65]